MLFSAQIKAARAMLDLKQSDLAEITGLSTSTIKRLEGDDNQIKIASIETLEKIKTALEDRGIKFLPAKEADKPNEGFGLRIFPVKRKK